MTTARPLLKYGQIKKLIVSGTVRLLIYVKHTILCSAFHAVATRTDFLVRGVVRRRRAFPGLKTSSEEIGRNVRAHSFRFPRTRFFACQPKDAHQNLGRDNRTRSRYRFPRPRSLDNTLNEEISTYNHGFTRHPIQSSATKRQQTIPTVYR